jgi:hypothetical protein
MLSGKMRIAGNPARVPLDKNRFEGKNARQTAP